MDYSELVRQRIRKEKAQADKLAMENALKRGDDVLVKDVEDTWLLTISTAKSIILGLPHRMNRMISASVHSTVPHETQKHIENYTKETVYKALTDLSELNPISTD